MSEWWKNSCRPMVSLWYFVKLESPLCYVSYFTVIFHASMRYFAILNQCLVNQSKGSVRSKVINYILHLYCYCLPTDRLIRYMYQIASKGYNLVRTKFDRNRIKFIIKRPKAKKIIRHISGRAGTPVRLDFSYLVATKLLNNGIRWSPICFYGLAGMAANKYKG